MMRRTVLHLLAAAFAESCRALKAAAPATCIGISQKRHPEVYSQLLADRQQSSPASEGTSTQPKTAGVTEKRRRMDSDLDLATDESDKLEEAGVNSPCEIYLDKDGVGHIVSDDRPVQVTRNKRSLIWRHFEHLDSLNAARCHICMKKIQCSDGRSTSNLHRHLSKRHPAVLYSAARRRQAEISTQLITGLKCYWGHIDIDSDTLFWCIGRFKSIRGRKTNVQERAGADGSSEASAETGGSSSEDQRELLEMLRVGNAREAAAEREEIESLRKAQLEEAKYLRREQLVLLSNKPDPVTI
ncbi:hypothetical protein KUCAC02_002691 [Chaenocephalus aceratus]|uniref:Uncharacterized protein n=1 Tax=Chaenocephalus aceratus TaxID=36190 RepID=A0ACB9XW07_CHAAC|nr:hypothetical protein KUCAC02_002691 [Chaenocephalus aceratus]